MNPYKHPHAVIGWMIDQLLGIQWWLEAKGTTDLANENWWTTNESEKK